MEEWKKELLYQWDEAMYNFELLKDKLSIENIKQKEKEYYNEKQKGCEDSNSIFYLCRQRKELL